jgi:glycosyltransferase involved in cell wall biosynthesis
MSQMQAKKIMLLTKKLNSIPSGGRELLIKLNYDILSNIYEEKLILFELPDSRVNLPETLKSIYYGHIDGLNKKNIEFALNIICSQEVKQVFVDGSNLGAFVKALKQSIPNVEITTFFHNVEARFFWGSLCDRKTPRAAAVFLANFLAEQKAVKYSDKLICLTERDSKVLMKIYGIGATHIAPMVLEDKHLELTEFTECNTPEQFAIFVGGNFYANREGVAWFVKEIIPLTELRLFIIGRGFESLKAELEVRDRVTVVGSVDNLADWYHRAKFVIAPIFDGSGMKTKVAEALMYGKKIIGSSEAFIGYENIIGKAGWVCNSPTDFVDAIAEAKVKITKSFDQELRNIYEQYYSKSIGTERLRNILSAK